MVPVIVHRCDGAAPVNSDEVARVSELLPDTDLKSTRMPMCSAFLRRSDMLATALRTDTAYPTS